VIEIVPPRPEWAQEYARLEAWLREALGPLALRVDHIGSTAVPGLDAKDIVDVQVTVAALDATVLDAPMAAAGLVGRPDIVRDHVPLGGPDDPAEWRKLYYREAEGPRRLHVHVRQAGRANQRYPLLFRDYLRANPAAAAAYAEIKRQLARLHPQDVDAYYDVKDPVCDLILQAAELWATRVKWTPELDPLQAEAG
jgi:GrpB-like predicted nucleotidyltransferase (UPF0157 family)